MYFDHCTNLDELRAAYKRLAIKYHPDMGGDTRIMQDINIEFDRVFNALKNSYNSQRTTDQQTTETPDKFRSVIDKLITLDGLKIELCGSWLWIGGNTYPHKDTLKSAGCKWSRSKRKWYWHHKDDGASWSRGRCTMDEIRGKYGSQVFDTVQRHKLTA